MSPAPARARARGRKKKAATPAWLRLWPLILGIVATPFAVRAAGVLALTGTAALRELYPYVVLVGSLAQHLSPEQTETLSQWIMWGQFPVYGLVWMAAARLLGRSGGPLAVLVLHGAGVAAAIFAANA